MINATFPYRAAAVILTLLIALSLSMHADGAMYHCVDGSGAKVFSDSPAQLQDCAAVTADLVEPAHPASTPARPFEARGGLPEPGAFPNQAERPRSVPAGSMIIVLERTGHLLVVDAHLNEQRHARLILDTGASHTIVSHAIARDLGLAIDTGGSAVTLNTAGGPVQAEMSQMRAMRVGEAEAFNIPVAVHDLPDAPAGIEGLLGMTFLTHFLMTLDTHTGTLMLQRR